jgi:tetratricopeptide (TPR) repeat protein
VLITLRKPDIRVEDILAVYQDQAEYRSVTILAPLNETLFPPEIVPPTFRWKDSRTRSDTWLVTVKFQDGKGRLNFLAPRPRWTAKAKEWEAIKRRSLEKDAEVTVLGFRRSAPRKILSEGRVSIKTSKDKVGAPLFYREVNLPFVDAVKDPSYIRWRFGAISSPKQPPIVLENLPVCGNCHSFSADGKTLGMDVDYANDKGSYTIAQVKKQMLLARDSIITWNDYRKEDGEQTFGLLSQVSPDGKFIVSTVKDRSVFVPKPGLEFSQLFFPIKGILCIYNRETRTFQELPGADDPEYVQSNPTWSPDGKYIVFAKAKTYELKGPNVQGKILLSPEDCKEFLEEGKAFLFDLYRIAFNDGKGGKPEPIQGASNNGMSNYFARYSPDGKWIVFCKAKSYMLLQPDSELYIIPAEGGKPRRLRANTNRMNSWHSWSPNGKWLVFSSKANSPYTQLFLTHIDEQGHSTPPVLLSHFTAPDRAANIPEFVNTRPTAIKKIREKFLDDYSYVRAAIAFLKAGDHKGAEQEYRKALELNPENVKAHTDLGYILLAKGMYKEGMLHVSEAIKLDPNNADAHYNLGLAMLYQTKPDQAIRYFSRAVQLKPDYAEAHLNLGVALANRERFDEAIKHYSMALQVKPDYAEAYYNLGEALSRQDKLNEAAGHFFKALQLRGDYADAYYSLGIVFVRQGKSDEAIRSWLEALRIKPDYADAHYNLGVVLASQGKLDEAIKHYSMALQIEPDYANAHYNLGVALARRGNLDKAIKHWLEVVRLDQNNIGALTNLADGYARTGQLREAVLSAEKALNLARKAGNEQLAQQIKQQIELYKMNKPLNNSLKENDNK